MVELQRVWLPSDWEWTFRAKVLSMLQREKNFWEWTVELQSTNTLLQGTASYLNEDALPNQIEENWQHELSEVCRNKLTDKIHDFHLWLETVQ